MAKTRKDLVSNGSSTVYNITFELGYIEKEHVYVYAEGDDYINQLNYNWISDTRIELESPVPSGDTFHIRRVVPRDELVNDYETGAILREDNLDSSFLQALMILEEISDGYFLVDGSEFTAQSDVDMNGYKLIGDDVINAIQVFYDRNGSDLEVENVQEAIDALDSYRVSIQGNLNSNNETINSMLSDIDNLENQVDANLYNINSFRLQIAGNRSDINALNVNKMNRDVSASMGNVAVFNSSGHAVDSDKSIDDIINAAPTYSQETVPTGTIPENAIWYNPSIPAYFIYYVDGDSGQWVEVGQSIPSEIVPNESKYTTSSIIYGGVEFPEGTVIATTGYLEEGDGGGGLWRATGTNGLTPSQTPAESNSGGLVDGVGVLWERLGNKFTVRSFGAVGDGITDDLPALKAAIAAAPSTGCEITFNDGVYFTPREDVTNLDSWLLIEKDGIKLKAENKWQATLKNIIVLVRGSYGNKYPLGVNVEAGEKTITTSTAHDLKLNSYVQVISAVNPYSTDAGKWQGGSVNPTKNTRPDALLMENHRVARVDSSTEVTMYDEIMFDDVYKTDTTGQNVTVDGVSSAYIREVAPVVGFTCEGLVLLRNDGKSFRGVYFQRTQGCEIRGCMFLTNDGDDGRHVHAEESMDFSIVDCIEHRNPTGASGSSWNSFTINGGCSNVRIHNNRFYGGSQIIDITPGLDSNLLFDQPRDLGPDSLSLTVYGVSLKNNFFSGAGDAFTSHPATMMMTITGNTIENGSVGFRIRSRINTITGNIIRTRQAGVSLAAFYDDTLISDNIIKQLPSPVGNTWLGINAVPTSSEIMNNNNTRNVVVEGNTITADNDTGAYAIGVQLRHVSNGVPPNEAFGDFTTEIKTAISNHVIEGNKFRGCGITMKRYVNGTVIRNNRFTGNPVSDYWIEGESNDCIQNEVDGNVFDRTAPTADIKLSNSTTETYSATVIQFVGVNTGLFASITVDVPDDFGYVERGRKGVRTDGISMVNGGQVKTSRASGDATLYLTAEAQDGVSRSYVRINDTSKALTSDARTYNNGLLVQQGSIWANPDNTYQLGAPSFRWSEVFAANGTISTSDAREKQQQRSISDAEQKVAQKIRTMLQAFKWTEAVNRKGDNARWHFGVMAQEIKDVFEEFGLDAHKYAMFCYDEWEEQTEQIVDETTGEVREELLTKAGNRYGIRYDQLLVFLLASLV